MSGHATPGGRDQRGQTSVDFVIALGVFLLVMVTVAGFLPEMFAAFDERPERSLVADRTADQVVHTLAVDGGEPGVLNETCAGTVLRQNATACGYDPGESLTRQLGLESRYRVNVSLRANRTGDATPEVLCTDGSRIGACTGGDDRLAVGPAVPQHRSSVDAASRIVTVDGSSASVVVNVW